MVKWKIGLNREFFLRFSKIDIFRYVNSSIIYNIVSQRTRNVKKM